MYGEQIAEYNAKTIAPGKLDHNPTVGENLDAKIKSLENELQRLKDSRETLGPLLNMRIRDVRDAMSY